MGTAMRNGPLPIAPVRPRAAKWCEKLTFPLHSRVNGMIVP